MLKETMMDGEKLQIEADKAWRRGNKRRAFQLLKNAVESGDTSALHNFAYFYDEGIGTKRDNMKALHFYRKSFRHGELSSAINIGLIYKEQGNLRRSIFWLRRAMALGEPEGAYELARIYLKRNSVKAEKLLLLVLKAKNLIPQVREEAEELLRSLRKSHPFERVRGT